MAYVTFKGAVLLTAEFLEAPEIIRDVVSTYFTESISFYVPDTHLVFPGDTLTRVELQDAGIDCMFAVRVKHLCIMDSDLSAAAPTPSQFKDFGKAKRQYQIGAPDMVLIASKFEIFGQKSINLNAPKEFPMTKMTKAYQEVSNIALDLKSKLLGIMTCEGLVTYDGSTISLNPVSSFAMPAPSMALRTPLSKIRKGDIMLNDGEPVFVASSQSKSGSFDIIKTNGANETISPVNNTLLGNPGVLIVQNQFSDMTDASVGALLLAGGSSIDDADYKAKKLAGYEATGLLGAPEAPKV